MLQMSVTTGWGGLQILPHPALVANLHRVVGVPVYVNDIRLIGADIGQRSGEGTFYTQTL